MIVIVAMIIEPILGGNAFNCLRLSAVIDSTGLTWRLLDGVIAINEVLAVIRGNNQIAFW